LIGKAFFQNQKNNGFFNGVGLLKGKESSHHFEIVFGMNIGFGIKRMDQRLGEWLGKNHRQGVFSEYLNFNNETA
jgi:hypothetical protein